MMKCPYCERRCELDQEHFGVCRMYHAVDGRVEERFPCRWSTYDIQQMESLPFYHAYPGGKSMAIGTTGCNFDCRYCVNAYIAKEDPEPQQASMYPFTPEELVRMAVKLGCRTIVFNVNEPTVSLPSLLEVGRAARAARIPMGCLTNAYMTEMAAEQMAEVFSFFNISLKGLAPAFYREYIGVPDGEPVLRNIRTLARTRHLEITTPVIEGVNDVDLPGIAEFIASVDREIPWHVFRLQPDYKMKEAAYPRVEAINAALEHSRRMLPYIYFHNFIGSDWVDTQCPECGTTVIERLSLGCGGDILGQYHCQGSRCPHCGYELKICGRHLSWNEKEAAV